MATEIKVPFLPEPYEETTLIWQKNPGDRVLPGETLAMLESGGGIVRLTSPVSGVIERLPVQNGTKVKGEQVIAVMQAGEGPSSSLFAEIQNFALTALEYYHLLKRYAATLTVWDARNLNLPGSPVPLVITDLNPLYRAWNRGCCLVVAPVDLMDSRRTDWHALQAAHALVFYVIQTLKWDRLELTGLDTMVSRALVTTLLLGATALRCNITEKERKIVETLRQAPPQWLKPLQAPGQAMG